MRKIIFILLMGFLILPGLSSFCEGRNYVPVDQLGNASITPRVTSNQISRKLNRNQSASRAPSSRTYMTESGKIKLFGTLEFPKALDPHSNWADAVNRNASHPVFILTKHFNKSTTWGKLKNSLEGKAPLDQMRIVNSFWNGWPYKEDLKNYGVPDYWASPSEFIIKSGDCEDYAIAKYFTLKEIGFDPQKMRIVVLRDTVLNQAHAVLVIYLDNEVYVLDNLAKKVLSHKAMLNYLPQFSVNEFGRWAHVQPKKTS